MNTHDESQQSRSQPVSILRYLPMAIFVVILLVLNPLFFLFVEAIDTPTANHIMGGFLMGELLLAGLIGGLFGRHWLLGYSVSISLSLVGLGIIWLVTDHEVTPYRQLPWFWRACHVPATLFLGTLPLLCLRLLRKWRIAQSVHVKPAMRVENVLLVTSIIGSVLTLLIMPTIVSRSYSTLAGRFDYVLDGSELIRDELRFAAWGAISMFLAAPVVAIFLDHRWRPTRRLLVVGLYLLAMLPLSIWLVVAISNSPNRSWEFGIGLLVAYGVVFVGLACIRACGLRLHSCRTDSIAGPTLSSVQQSWFPRLVTAGILLIAIGASVLANGHQRRAQQALADFAEVRQVIESKGGKIDGTTFQTAGSISFGPEMDDTDMERIANCANIDRISLARSRVTDAGAMILTKFPAISDLDLSHTTISDATLDKLHGVYDRLRLLNLSHTNITIEGVNRLLKQLRVNTLNLSDNGWSDEQISQLNGNPRTILLLNGNPLTGTCLANLAKYRGLGLGRNQFTDQWWQHLSRVPEVLMLEGADIDDQACAGICSKTSFIDRLKIQHTSISNAGIAMFRQVYINTLELGEGQITDDGLSQASLKVAYQLKLSGPFTGSCLKNWRPGSIAVLELSDSKVTDADLTAMAMPDGVLRLGLGNTQVSDEGMAAMANHSFEIVDLVNSKVSASYISNSSNIKFAFVEPGKFSNPQLANNRSSMRIRQSPISVRLLDDLRQPNLNPDLIPPSE